LTAIFDDIILLLELLQNGTRISRHKNQQARESAGTRISRHENQQAQESAGTPHNISIRNQDRKNKDFSLYRLSFIPLPLFLFAQDRLFGPLLMKF